MVSFRWPNFASGQRCKKTWTNWKDRMENEDKITNGNIEWLHSMETSSGSGGSHVGDGFPGGQDVWLPSRIDLKGRGVRSRIRETGLTVDKAKEPVIQVKSLTPANHDKFDWEMTDKDQENFDLKMMVFLWFKSEVTTRDRKMAQLDISQYLQSTPIVFGGEKIRATLELIRLRSRGTRHRKFSLQS